MERFRVLRSSSATLLRTGVMLAAAVVLFGAVLYLTRHGHEVANYTTFHGEPESLKSPERHPSRRDAT